MVGKQQMGLAISEDQRRPWVELITRTADEIGLPEDPELRSAFVAYLEWAPAWPGRTRPGRPSSGAGPGAAVGGGERRHLTLGEMRFVTSPRGVPHQSSAQTWTLSRPEWHAVLVGQEARP